MNNIIEYIYIDFKITNITMIDYTLYTIRVQQLIFILYRSLKYYQNLPCYLYRIHDI